MLYTEKLRAATDALMIDSELKRLFTPLDGGLEVSAEHDHRFDLRDLLLKEFIAQPNRDVCLLLGSAGSGKSWFGQALVAHLWGVRQASDPIPLWIPLLSIENPTRNLLDQYLHHLKRLSKIRIEDAEQHLTGDEIHSFLREQPPVFLVLDGYDECDEVTRKRNLYQDNHFELWQGGVQVIVTSREDVLPKQYASFFRSKRATSPHIEYHLQPFNEEQLSFFIKKYTECHKTDWSADSYLEKLTTIYELKEFIGKPFLLSMVLEVLPDILAEVERQLGEASTSSSSSSAAFSSSDKAEEETTSIDQRSLLRHRLTRNGLYRRFLDRHYAREIIRLEKMGKRATIEAAYPDKPLHEVLDDFTRRLAQQCFAHHVTRMTWKSTTPTHKSWSSSTVSPSPKGLGDKTIENPGWLSDFFDDAKHPEGHLPELRAAAPLVPIGMESYKFIHISILEFYAAEHLFGGALADGWMLTGRNLNKENLQLSPEVLSFLAERAKTEDLFKKTLFSIIEQSKYESSVWRAAANAITILNYANVSFSGRDCRRIRIGGLEDESDPESGWGADLTSALLGGTNLQEADLRWTKLQRACIAYANLSAACMDGVYFGESPFLEMPDKIGMCRYSPDEIHLIISAGKYVYIHDVNSEKTSARPGKHRDNIRIFDLDSTGRYLASGDDSSFVYVWDCINMQLVSSFKSLEPIRVIAISSNKRRVASANLRTIHLYVYEAGTGILERVLNKHTGVMSGLLFAMDGPIMTLISSAEDKQICFWDIENGTVKVLESLAQSRCLRISKDHKYIATGNWDDSIAIWEAATKKLVSRFKTYHNVVVTIDYAFVQDEYVFVSGGREGNLCFWQVSSGRLLQTISGTTAECINSTTINEAGQVSFTKADDNKVYQMDLDSIIGKLSKHYDVGHLFNGDLIHKYGMELTALGASHDYRYTVSAGADGRICIWKAETGKLLNKFEVPGEVFSLVTFSRDKMLIAAFAKQDTSIPSQGKKNIYIWDVNVSTFIKKHPYEEKNNFTFLFTPDNCRLILIDHYGIHILDVSTGRVLRKFDATFRDLDDFFYMEGAFALYPDGSCVAFGASEIIAKALSWTGTDCITEETTRRGKEIPTNRSVSLWDLPDDPKFTSILGIKKLSFNEFKKCERMAFSPEGQYMAISAVSGFYILDLSSKKLLHTLKRIYLHSDEMSFSSDSCYLAVTDSYVLKIIDVVSGRQILELMDRSVSFTWGREANNNLLITSSPNGNIFCWRLVQTNGETAQLQLYWSSNCPSTTLVAKNAKISQITGIDGRTSSLLHQRGAIGKPANPKLLTSEKVLDERNKQVFIPEGKITQPWLKDETGNSYIITSSMWLISLVRKRNVEPSESKVAGQNISTVKNLGGHVWLLLQGLDDANYTIIKTIHLYRDTDKPAYLRGSIGTGLIQVRACAPYDLYHQAQEKTLVCSTNKMITREQVDQLLTNVEKDRQAGVNYLISGHAPTFHGAYSCLSWCERQLNLIGADAIEDKKWIDYVCAIPSRYIPKASADVEGLDTGGKKCLVM